MRAWIIFIGMAWCVVCNAIAQPCKKIIIDDGTQKRILIDYIDIAVRQRAFVGDKGVVEVVRYVNENGRPSWLIKTTIEDSYKDNPPVEWASLDKDIILFYDAHSSMHDIVKRDSTPELLRCLDEAIGDRLYIRPPRRDRSKDTGFKTPSGKPIIIDARRLYAGNVSNSIVIVFEADGSISKYHPV